MAKDRGDTKASSKQGDVMVKQGGSRRGSLEESLDMEFDRAFADALRDILIHERYRTV
jgi:hypothetical protein